MLTTCKKDKLKDDKEILIGIWNWKTTSSISNMCTKYSSEYIYDTLTPLSEKNNYSIEFLKKGKINFYKNDEKINSKRIVFKIWRSSIHQNWTYDCSITLNNDNENRMSINVKNDSLLIRQFPFDDGDCNNSFNYFTKQ